MILSNDSLVAFHYRSYGTFFLHKNRLHNIYRGFTHYKYYRAIKRRKLVKTRAEIPCAIRYWPLVPDKPQAIPATTVNRVPFKLFDMALLTILCESSPSLDCGLQSIELSHPFHRYDSIGKWPLLASDDST